MRKCVFSIIGYFSIICGVVCFSLKSVDKGCDILPEAFQNNRFRNGVVELFLFDNVFSVKVSNNLCAQLSYSAKASDSLKLKHFTLD